MFSLEPNPFSLMLFLGILNNQLMHQHHPVDRIVRNCNTVVDFDDFFEDNRPELVNVVRFKDDSFELWTYWFLLSSRTLQPRDNSVILVLSLHQVYPSFCDSNKPGNLVRIGTFLHLTDDPPYLSIR